MDALAAWYSDGFRWLASLFNGLTRFADRMDSAPGGRAYICPCEACDEARGRNFRYY